MTTPPRASPEQEAEAQARLAALGRQVETIKAVNEQLLIASLEQRELAERAERALDELAARSTIDTLTQLPNRGLLVDRVEQAIANARRHGCHCALLFFDIDNFKQYNDQHGHAFGDDVLCLVARRLTATLREMDTASRHGGDEFLVLLAEVAQPADARAVAEKLAAAIAEPAVIDGRAIGITASVGVALYPEDGRTVAALVAAADVAMYEGKRRQARSFRGQRDFVAAVAQTLGDGVEPALADLQTVVARHLAHRSGVLAQSLAASGAGASGGEPGCLPVDLRSIVDAAVAACRPLAEGRRQRLQWQPPAQALPALGPVAALLQLLENLLDSASLYSAAGAVIVVTVVDARDERVLRVHHLGPGLDQDQDQDLWRASEQLARACGGSLGIDPAGQGGDALLCLPLITR